MVINEFHSDAYCWIPNVEIELAPRVTMIFGENGSGKSRLLESVYLYARHECRDSLDFGSNRIFIDCFGVNRCCISHDIEPVIAGTLGDNPFSNFMRECFRGFTKGLGRFEIVDLCECEDMLSLCLKNKAGKSILTRNLPSSYMRLFNIIMEIAVSSYATEKNFDINGFVLIDDIDLHLSPLLQQTVMERFTRTFPNVQFVVTTHSPIVLSHLPQDKNNRIYQIVSDGYTCNLLNVGDAYGLDYNSVVSLVMGVHDRNPYIQATKDLYVYLMRIGNTDKAAIAAEEIKRLFPDSYESVLKEMDEKVNQA